MRDFFSRLVGGPILDAVAWLVRKIRERAYADVEGRHYQYKTNPIDIVEGPASERWLLLPNVRRSVSGLPEFRSLLRHYPCGVRQDEGSRSERIEVRSLAELLAKAQDMRTRRFRIWLEREVIFPANKKASTEQR
jgi:hypothetical protein